MVSKAPVDHIDQQAYCVLRELASNQTQSFSDQEMGARIGVDPYNIARRAARFQRRLEGFAERIKQERKGFAFSLKRRIYVWRLAGCGGRSQAQ